MYLKVIQNHLVVQLKSTVWWLQCYALDHLITQYTYITIISTTRSKHKQTNYLSENKTTNETKISIKKSVESLVLSEGHISGKIAFSSTWSALWYDRSCLTNLNLTNQRRRLGSSVAGKISKQSWLESSKGLPRSSPSQPPPPSFVCTIVDWSPKQALAGDFSYFRLINHTSTSSVCVFSSSVLSRLNCLRRSFPALSFGLRHL